jgi:hypothetical protein
MRAGGTEYPLWRPGVRLARSEPYYTPLRRPVLAVTALSAMLALGACGGGGGGGSTVSPPPTIVTPPSPPPPPPPPPPPSFTPPSATSTEYLRNYGLTNIHASAAYNAGATGAGVTVAVVDSGVNHTQADIAVNVSPSSTDIYTSRNVPDGEDNHGTLVAGVIGAAFNGFGTIGVAYNSTILGVRVDSPGSCAAGPAQSPPSTKSTCDFLASDIAKGIDYAVAHGAKIINLSLGGPGGGLGGSFESSLTRAINAGVVFTIAAGNESNPNPDFPAAYATDPRYIGSILAVGSTDQTNTISSFSNLAGSSASEFVVAPGDNIITGCDGTSCFRASGTSFSAPHVAGALALLLQAFPNLTGKAAIALLIQTADDLGPTGVDSTYGSGLIDLQKAFQPVGTMSLASTTGTPVAIREQLGSNLSGAFGDSIRRSSALTTVAFDSYNRLFQVNLGDGFHAAPRTSFQGSTAPQPQSSEVSIAAAPGVSLSLGASRSSFANNDPLQGLGFQATQEAPADMRFAARAGAFSFQAWRGQGGVSPAPSLAASHDGFASLARADHAVQAGYDIGGVTLGGEVGGGSRYTLYGLANLEPSHYALATAAISRGPFSAQLSYGSLSEPQGPLGSFLPGSSSFGLPSTTRFLSLHSDWLGNRNWVLSAEGSMGSTRAAGGIVAFDGAIVSSTWRLTARGRCANDADCFSALIQIDQPVRIESGRFIATLADVPLNYDDPVQFSTRHFSADPSGRQIDLRLGFDRSWARWGVLELQGVAIINEANQANATMNYGLTASWRSQF